MVFAVALVVLMLQTMIFAADVKNICMFADDESSQAVKEGIAKIAPLYGHSYTSYQTTADGSFMYTVGICAIIDTDKPTAAVIQQKMENGKASDPRIVGVLDQADIMSGTDWAVLEYKGTEKTECEDKRAVVMLQCDQSVDDGKAQMVFMKEKNQASSCYFLFELKHKAMCPKYSSSSGLSVGSILVIVFFCVAGVYLLVGFLYSRFVLGSKGVEQIPNYEFWKDFGNLQADGCDFVCRSKERRSHGFGGIGDDQLDPHTEEIRDDNLLPM